MNRQLAEELGKASGKELSQGSSGIDRLSALDSQLPSLISLFIFV